MTDSAPDREGTREVTMPANVSSDSSSSAGPDVEPGVGIGAQATGNVATVSADDDDVAERPSWDLPTAVVGLVVMAAVTTTAAMLGMFLGWAGVGCGSPAGCNDALIITGLFFGTLGVIITAIVFLVITIARITVKRVAWWLPLLGIGAVVFVFAVGALMAGIGSAS